MPVAPPDGRLGVLRESVVRVRASGWAADRATTLAAVLAFGLGLATFVLYPLVEILRRSVEGTAGPTLAHYAAFLKTPQVFAALGRSLWIAGLSTVLTILLAFAFAYVMARIPLPGRGLYAKIALLPLISPSFVQALALIFLFGRNGLITRHLLDTSWSIYGWHGIVISEVFYCFPHAFLVLEPALRSVDARLYEAAASLRTPSWRAFARITLPEARYALASASFLVFNLVITDFGNPVIIGGGYSVLATEIYTQVIGLQNFAMASVISMVLLVPAVGAFLLDNYFGRRSIASIGGAARPYMIPVGRLGRWMAAGFVATVMVGILLIYGTILGASIVRIWGYDFGLTLRHYRFDTAGGYGSIWTSVGLAGAAAAIGGVATLVLAYLLERRRPRGAWALTLLALLPAAVPGTVMGLGYVLAFNKGLLILTGTATIVILSHLFRFFPLGLLTSRTKVKQLDPALEEACQSLRTPVWRILVRVIFPLARSAVAASVIYIFIRSMVTLSAVIFLVSPDVSLAAVSIMLLVNDGKLNAAAAMSVVVVLVILIVLGIGELLARAMGGDQRPPHSAAA